MEASLSNYEKAVHTINDQCYGRLKGSVVIIDVKLRKDTNIPPRGSQYVKTEVFIDGPVRKFSMFIKKHKDSPAIGLLKTNGFISPYENSLLQLEMHNPSNIDLR